MLRLRRRALVFPTSCIPNLPLVSPLDQLQHDSVVQQEQHSRNSRAGRSHNNRHLSRNRVLTYRTKFSIRSTSDPDSNIPS
jgi:hypothetical protein